MLLSHTAYLNAKKRIGIIITGLVSLFFVYCIFLTAARKSLLCAIITLVLWVVWIYLPGRGRNNSKSILVRIAAVVIFGALAIYYVMQNMMDSQMFYRFQSLLSGGDGSLHKRLNMYVEGFKTFLSNPIFGYGFGGYQDIYGGYSHATVVEIPVSGGVIGMLLYITFFVQMIIGAKRSIKLEELPFFGVVPKPLYVTNIRSTGSFLKLICLIRGSREVCMMNVR